MAKFRTLWASFVAWVDAKIDRRKTLSQIMTEGDEDDKLAITQAEKTIVEHQYLVHMHRANIAARASWRRMQLEHNGSEGAEKPVPHSLISVLRAEDEIRIDRFPAR